MGNLLNVCSEELTDAVSDKEPFALYFVSFTQRDALDLARLNELIEVATRQTEHGSRLVVVDEFRLAYCCLTSAVCVVSCHI